MRIALASLALLAACSSAPTETARPEEAREARPAETPREAAPRESPAEAIAIGWDHLPADPDAAARAANAEALRIHGHASGAREGEARRVYEGSLAAFQRVAAEHPDYLFARFNVACALARLGRSDEAIAILRALLAIDLPTFGPRLDADPDLASLPSAPGFAALTEHRAALRARYAAALREGVPLVRVTPMETIAAASDDVDGRQRRTFQAGVWLASERRFVPMAPLSVREVDAMIGDLFLTALVIDRERDAVLSFEGLGSWSEGGPLSEGTFVVHEAGTGVERARLSSTPAHPWCPPIMAHATSSGVALRFVEASPDAALPSADRFDASVLPRLVVSLRTASVQLPHGMPPDGVSLEGDSLRAADGESALPPEHHVPPGATRTTTWVRRDASSFYLLTAGIESSEWDPARPVHPALSVVSLDEGQVTVQLTLSASEGVGALIAGPDGAAYAQVGDRTYRLGREGAPELLPEGLRILASPPGPS